MPPAKLRNCSLACLAFLAAVPALAELRKVVDLNTPREFPNVTNRVEWETRARQIREQILVSAGLWPVPEKTPLNPVIFGKVLHADYSIEKVYFQTTPGFYLAGNLYRPVGKGNGAFPAILNPHGHSPRGRLEDETNSSTVARCANFARQGMIAFAYDMVGYNDTHFPETPPGSSFSSAHWNFATNNPACQLWNVSLMGLQTWDSIRALDFLESLPDVDTQRLAITGESGGGTQTFILGALDSRLAAQAPVVMVSHTMQGGCLCENMPGLRVEFSNVEIAAAACPRPQLLVAASGDWTATTPTMEGPALQSIYELLRAPDRLRYVRFDAPHNYNQHSREAVYRWFDRWLLARPDQPVSELAYQTEPDENLRVFPDGKLPPDALSQEELIRRLIGAHREQLHSLAPRDSASLGKYREVMEPAWRHTLQLDPIPILTDATNRIRKQQEAVVETRLKLDAGEVSLRICRPARLRENPGGFRVVLVHPEGAAPFFDAAGLPTGLAGELVFAGLEVVVVGGLPAVDISRQTSPFFTTYNRTQIQENVRTLIAVCRLARNLDGESGRVILCGTGRAGLWCLLAAPEADAVVADAAQLDVTDDTSLLAPDLFCPGIRIIDSFAGAAILAAPKPLLVHNASPLFPSDSLRAAYSLLQKPAFMALDNHLRENKDIVSWILQLK